MQENSKENEYSFARLFLEIIYRFDIPLSFYFKMKIED